MSLGRAEPGAHRDQGRERLPHLHGLDTPTTPRGFGNEWQELHSLRATLCSCVLVTAFALLIGRWQRSHRQRRRPAPHEGQVAARVRTARDQADRPAGIHK